MTDTVHRRSESVLVILDFVCLQGRNELRDHAGGPSEEDHEQHTDNESTDAAPPRYRRPGVMDCNQPSGPEWIRSVARAEPGRTLDVNTCLLCLT